MQIPLCCWLILLPTSRVHLIRTFLSAFIVSAVCCEGSDIFGQGRQMALMLSTLYYNYVIPLKLTLILWGFGTFRFFAHVSTAEKCCDQCVNAKCALSVSYTVLQIRVCSSPHDMICQCALSASTQLIVHAQLWCQSLCGKPWCMEWGACWAVWVCCCHDNHPLDNWAAQKRWLGVVRV